VLEGTSSNIDSNLSRDICVSSTQLNSPVWSIQRLSPT
jgi:hypothetical protein